MINNQACEISGVLNFFVAISIDVLKIIGLRVVIFLFQKAACSGDRQ
jgi:hypothetical protein